MPPERSTRSRREPSRRRQGSVSNDGRRVRGREKSGQTKPAAARPTSRSSSKRRPRQARPRSRSPSRYMSLVTALAHQPRRRSRDRSPVVQRRDDESVRRRRSTSAARAREGSGRREPPREDRRYNYEEGRVQGSPSLRGDHGGRLRRTSSRGRRVGGGDHWLHDDGGSRARSREHSGGRSGASRVQRDIAARDVAERGGRRRNDEPLRHSRRISEAARKHGDEEKQGKRGESRRLYRERDADDRMRDEDSLWRSRESRRSASHHRDHLRRDAECGRRESSWGRASERGAYRGDMELEMRSKREDHHTVDTLDRGRPHKRAHSRSVRSSKRAKRDSWPREDGWPREGSRPRSRLESRTREEKVVDDEEGHLVFHTGYVLQDRYKVLEELGEGTFGKVVKCQDLRKDKVIAIKIIRNIKKYRDAAKLEINVLSKLAKYDPKCRFKCVQMYDSFDYHGHKCIAFQLLGKSVFDFLKDNDYQPYPMEHVRQMSYELCLSVNFLHKNRITHTDLKPENVLFFDSSYTKEPIPNSKARTRLLKNPEIRLIDFGSATFDHEHHSSVIQTRHYRAPEVILKLGWSHACDVWSVGCIIFELALGFMLFDTHSSHEHLAMMERVLGKFPQDMATRTSLSYFSKGKLCWTEGSKEDKQVRRKVKPLERFIPKEWRDNGDWLEMFDLIRRMLEFNPDKRITLSDAMEHPFLKRAALRQNSRSSSGYVSR